MEKIRGKVKFFNFKRGFGFVEADGEDFFVHVTNIVGGDMLLDGEGVTFKPVQGHKGWQALEVERLNPPSMKEEEGVVSKYDKERGYGFISREGKADVFAHFSDFQNLARAEDVEQGMRVKFAVRSGRDGRDRAYKIELVD